MPSSGPVSAAAAKAALTSSALVSRAASTVRSTTEPMAMGARIEKPWSLPSSSGITRPIAFAAPVEVGTRLIAAARARHPAGVARLDRARVGPERRVVLEQLAQRPGVGEVVDGDPLDVGSALPGGAEGVAPDASEAVDPDAHGHVCGDSS